MFVTFFIGLILFVWSIILIFITVRLSNFHNAVMSGMKSGSSTPLQQDLNGALPADEQDENACECISEDIEVPTTMRLLDDAVSLENNSESSADDPPVDYSADITEEAVVEDFKKMCHEIMTGSNSEEETFELQPLV